MSAHIGANLLSFQSVEINPRRMHSDAHYAQNGREGLKPLLFSESYYID